ncbi:stalk domain-containing protein [Paenibacillus flagellatus]|uniref:stalk domain-containing protein n=1 Tax=Paenibacillus flagellatus TaxID=2211139 RepID=UPI001305255C|nr:stalk domain-containing protein [Paenibacillus flagellatus]
MKKFVAGIIVGVTLTIGSSVFADQIKQFVLTAASYPIFVNGKEFADPEHPVLNYEGSTYVPLAKLGDLTGVQYKWNDDLKRVEIDTKQAGSTDPAAPGTSTGSVAKPGSGLPQGGVLTPDVEIRESTESGFFTRDGVVMYEAVDRAGNNLGVFSDEDEESYMMAKLENKPLPPKLSEGWMQGGFLYKVYQVDSKYEGNDLVFYPIAKKDTEVLKELARLNLPSDWRDKESGETTANGIKVKRHNKINYFSIEDLKKVGLIG